MADKKDEDQDQQPQEGEPVQIPLPDFEDRKDFGWGEDSDDADESK